MAFTKTRWKIEPDRIVIYPHQTLMLLGILLAVVFAAIFFVARSIGEFNLLGPGTARLAFVLLFVTLYFIFSGCNHVVFDRSTGIMRQLLLGFLPVKSIAFDQLHGVGKVTHTGAYFNYRINTKENKFGKGITLSCGYSKETNTNAIAFATEVIPLIHQYLDAADPLPPQPAAVITEFRYFTESGGVFKLKKAKAGLLLSGFVLSASGLYVCFDASILNATPIASLLIGIAVLGFGVLIIANAFTTLTFHTHSRIVERKSPLGIRNAKLAFESFINFQTIRNTYNGIYTGTDVVIYFEKEPGSSKAVPVQLTNFRNTQKIERLLQEVETIMK